MKQAELVTYSISDDGYLEFVIRGEGGEVVTAFGLDPDQALDLADLVYDFVCVDDDLDTIGITVGSA